MKKFLNARNIIILLIFIVAIVYIFFGRSDDTKSSKTYQLFYRFYNYDIPSNYNNTIMKLDYTDEKTEISVIYATDSENRREIRSFDVNNKEQNEHGQTVAITDKDGLKNYIIKHTEKICLIFDTLEEQGSEFYATWSQNVIDLITSSPYYTRGYEFVNGHLMYYEYFKEANSKFYFNSNDELIYLNSESLDRGFRSSFNSNINNSELYLYHVMISHDSIENSLIEMPEGYELKKVEENVAE